VDVIIRSRESEIGLESTVLDLTGSKPLILRPGAVTAEQIAGRLDMEVSEDVEAKENSTPRSPGMKYRHYAPRASMFLFSGDAVTVREQILKQACKLSADHKIGILTFKPDKAYEGYFCMSLTKDGDLEEASRNLFRILRQFDIDGFDVILAETVPETGIGRAIMNRLKRACDNK
jgi:L-threonylcarbamoyladenylate synthase